MSASDVILVVTKTPDTARVVSAALGNQAGTTVNACADLNDLTIKLKQTSVRAVIVDIEPRPEQMLAELSSLISWFPETRFIVVSPQLSNEWLLRAMEAGARHFLLKQDLPHKLGKVYERLVPEAARDQRSGTAVTVLSAGGGCGGTILAINLTTELSLDVRKTLLVDLDANYGAIAGYLGLHSEYGISDVLDDEGRIDGNLIRSTAVPYRDGIEVLLSPTTVKPLESAPLQYRSLSRFLGECARIYDFTVLDAPRIPLSAMVSLAAVSTVTLIVFELNVEDIRVAQLMQRALVEQGIAEDGVFVVASRWRKKHDMVSIRDARRALGSDRLVILSNDFRSASASINYGKPLADVAPRSSLRRDINKLAGRIQMNRTTSESLRGAA